MSAALFSQDGLLELAAAASTIQERLDNGVVPDGSRADDERINARLDAWCQAIAKGDHALFLRRLAWDGLEEAQVRRILGRVSWPASAPLPQWVYTLKEALRIAGEMAPQASGSQDGQETPSQAPQSGWTFLDPQAPLPYEELLAPFVLVARQQLSAQAGAAAHLLNEEAHRLMERALLEELVPCAIETLHQEFALARALAQSALERLAILSPKEASRAQYRRFIAEMRQGGLTRFFKRYPVLARMLATMSDLWVEANVEFLQRLAVDLPALKQHFGGGQPLGQVASIRPALSDPHRGRRRVIALAFASGRKLIYKPKDLGTEAAYQQLLAWCNGQDVALSFRVLSVLNRTSHGWVEFVEQAPCQDKDQARRYFQRAGMLLCLLYVLEATDCHFENLIASGEQPVLIDLETLMHHRPRLELQDEGAHAQSLAYEHLAHSVLRTGLLPNWQVQRDQRAASDISGLGGGADGPRQVEALGWQEINTDRMALGYSLVEFEPQGNIPMLGAVPLAVEDYADDLLAGFEQMYRFLLKQRDLLLAPDGPLAALATQQVRFVYRATRIYARLQSHLLHPQYLRDGADRSIYLELLGRAVLPTEGPLREQAQPLDWWPIFAAERQAMEQGDIPFFTARADSALLHATPDQVFEHCLEGPSFERVLARLSTLSSEDAQQQVAVIQGALYAHVARVEASPSVALHQQDAEDRSALSIPTAEELVAQALDIAQQIAGRAIRAADGSAAWIAPRYLVQAERFQLEPLGFDLYGGTSGVALFLGALEKVSGGAGHRDLALAALQPLRQALRRFPRRTARDLGIGGAAGLGSVVYVLTRLSHWLDDTSLLEDAAGAAELITPERIAQDRHLDVIEGAAGALLGLLALYDAVLKPVVLEKAVLCGQHLLKARTESPAGLRTWATLNSALLTGFSHGAAGIGYALLRLYALTGDAGHRAAAEEGFAYEESTYSQEAGNWPDLREPDQKTFMASWCHGAPGIGLARLGSLEAFDTPSLRQDIARAIQTTQQVGYQGQDFLCCGTLGRAETLLVASRRLGVPELEQSARRLTSQVLRYKEQTGMFALHHLLPQQVYNPAFFQGTSGIGYELLRLAHPDVLPSVLLWN